MFVCLRTNTVVAIAYHLQKTPYVFPIIGGRRVENLQKNLEALSITLSREQMSYLESVIPFDVGFPNWLIVSVYCGGGAFSSVLMLMCDSLGRWYRSCPDYHHVSCGRLLAQTRTHHTWSSPVASLARFEMQKCVNVVDSNCWFPPTLGRVLPCSDLGDTVGAVSVL